MVTTADLIRKGATLLNEPCPKCGGVQIRFQGNVFCVNEDDISSVLKVGGRPKMQEQTQVPLEKPRSMQSSYAQDPDGLRSLIQDKLALVAKELENSKDFDQQAKLLDLMFKYLETLELLSHKK